MFNKGMCWILLMLLLASCQSYKKVPYMQDVNVVNEAIQQENLYDAKIMPKDLLTIVVSLHESGIGSTFQSNSCQSF